MDGLRQDLRHAWRMMRRSPGFTLTVLLTLGIGIGANTAIFSFVDTLLLRPLPYPDSDRMVMVWQDFTATRGPEREWFTPPDLRDLRERVSTLEAITPLVGWGSSLTGVGEPEQLTGVTVAAGWFAVTRVQPALGRPFVDDDERGDGRIVVLSHGLWQRRFGGDAGIIGRTIRLNDEEHEVVGVMPPAFRPPLQPAELWRPFTTSTFSQGCNNSRGCYVLRVMARLRDDVGAGALRTELDALAAAIREDAPGEKAGLRFVAIPLHEQLAGPVKPALLALLGAVGLLLLIACINIANLLLARSVAREREVAVRTAIGARRPAILRQLLVESTLLGLAGGALGALVSLWGVIALKAMSPPGTPRLDEVAVDGRILLFAMALAAVTGVVFGLAPALQLSRTDLTRALREATGNRASTARHNLRSALVVGEIALALTLLAGAGLLMRSFVRLQAVDPGFRTENTLAIALAFPSSRYPDAERRLDAANTLVQRLAANNAVLAVGATSILPLGGSDNDTGFLIEGRPMPRDRSEAPVAWYRRISPGYFDAIGMRLLRGRGFTELDREGAPLVGIINETLARRYWPEGDPIGARISDESPDGPWITIVGIVADARQNGPDQPARGELFLPLAQVPSPFVTVVVHTAGDPRALVPTVRAEVSSIDPMLPLAGVTTMDEALRQATALPRLYLSFFAFFALIALALAAIGIYGVTAYAVAQRTPEIGVRMALGADSRAVLRLVLRQAIILVSAGLLIGTALAIGLSRLLANLLFDLSPTDPPTFVAIAIVLAVVGVVASWLPARRATRVDPLRALRTET